MPELVVGIDLVELSRFRRFLNAVSRAQLETIYTLRELGGLASRVDATPGLAARFAAKEAVIKALSVSGFEADWREIEIVTDAGAPRVVLSGALALIATASGLTSLALSMSHSRETAIAQVIGTRGDCSAGSGGDAGERL